MKYKSSRFLSLPQNASSQALPPTSLPPTHILHPSLPSYLQAESPLSSYLQAESSLSSYLQAESSLSDIFLVQFLNLLVQSSNTDSLLVHCTLLHDVVVQPSNTDSLLVQSSPSVSLQKESSNDLHFPKYKH